MMTPEIQQLLDYADESHEAAKVLINGGFVGFSAAQSYYTMFYLAQALLLTRELRFSSHSAVIAAYGKEFSKTGLLEPKFHRRLIVIMDRRYDQHVEGRYSVPLHSRGSRRTGSIRRRDADPPTDVGRRDHDGNLDRHDLPLPRAELHGKSLGEHHHRHHHHCVCCRRRIVPSPLPIHSNGGSCVSPGHNLESMDVVQR